MTLKHLALFTLLGPLACQDTENPTEVNDNELITTVTLTLSPTSGGEAITYSWSDPENDGSPVVSALSLKRSEAYDVEVAFFNALVDPVEDITAEVQAESDQHQVFFTGAAVTDGLVSYSYADVDSNGFPVGLIGSFTANALGVSDLTVSLRHLPPQGGVNVKTGRLAEEVRAGGFGSVPGATDAEVHFPFSIIE